jgi:hypothetical protein
VQNQDLLPTRSLCKFLDVETPDYRVSHFATDEERVTYGDAGIDLGLVIYHTPGHTPDSISIWDEMERVLFVGDSLYEWVPIMFPLESCGVWLYKRSLERLRLLVTRWNREGMTAHLQQRIYLMIYSLLGTSSRESSSGISRRVSLVCGHSFSIPDAEHFLEEVYDLLGQVENGIIQPKPFFEFRDVQQVKFERADGKISFAGPLTKFAEFISLSKEFLASQIE